MSLLTLAIWLTGIVLFLTAGISLLPDGENYPFPEEIATAIEQIWQYMFTLNMVFPIDTFLTIVQWGILILLITGPIWQSFVWLVKQFRS